MLNKLPKRSGNYRIQDNIEKFQLQINFRHVTSLLKLPSYEISEFGFSFDTYLNNSPDGESSRISTTINIRWQQKLLSTKEVELYKDINNCITEVHKKYHEWITAKPAKDVETKGRSRRSKKREKTQTESENVYQTNEIFTYVHEDNYHASEDNCSESMKEAKYMYIYADLSPDTQLVVLKWFPNEQLLHIYPDFNDMQLNPYFITIDNDYRHLYAYACANDSKSRIEPSNELNILPILTDLSLPSTDFLNGKTHWQTDQVLHEQFLMPPKRMQRFLLLFEIQSVCSYAYQPLHVRFQVHIPEHCLLEEGPSEAATHSSFSTPINEVCSDRSFSYQRSFFYGHSLELCLLCEESLQELEALRIYFELISIDNWGRERVEGYAYFATYLKAGKEVRTIQWFRPAENLIERLTRYFIGGRRKFNFAQFFNPFQSAEFSINNRFQCRMFNTGHMHVSCQGITQRNCELLSPCKSRYSGMTLDDILKAFIQAREKLEMLVLKEQKEIKKKLKYN